MFYILMYISVRDRSLDRERHIDREIRERERMLLECEPLPGSLLGPPSSVPPLSFEAAVALGRGGGLSTAASRTIPSPVPNGYASTTTPRARHHGMRARRHSDSDDEDWC